MSEDIKDFIARAQVAQQAHDTRPGIQTSLDFTIGDIEEDEMWREHTAHRIREMQVMNHPDHDCDPGDCNDYKGEA